MKIVEIELPIKVVSEANQRDHWTKRYRRTANQRAHIRVFCLRKISKLPDDASATITLTRLGKRALDTDNLAGAFKAVRDAIADLLGVDDGSDRLTWLYDQQKAKHVFKQTETKFKRGLFEPNLNGTGIRIKIEVYPSLESQAENAMEIFADMRQRGAT